jgi:hypothetical protein
MAFNIPIDTGIEDGIVTVSGSVALGAFGDSASIDAFARLRVSNPVTIFESKQIFDKQPLIWSDKTASGGLVTYTPGRASCYLTTDGTNGSTAIRQTKQRINYQPGKSLLIFMTFVMGNSGNQLRKRIGYFDDNNGIYFEQTAAAPTGLRFTIRSSVTGNDSIEQPDWNLDPLDGSGPSGITLDVTKSQIMIIDIEWLGVGRVRVGFVYNGIPVYAHEFLHANITDAVYMATPNLPFRYEISNTDVGDAGQLEEICATAISEGGNTDLGLLRSSNRGSTAISFKNTNGLVPIIGIRLKSGYIGSTIFPADFSIACGSSTTYLWQLILNPTVAGVDAASWTDLTNSAIQYDISRTNANSLSGGVVIKSGYVVGQGNNVSSANAGDLKSLLVMSADINNVPDELILAVQRIDTGGSNVDYYGSLSWRELM